MGTRSNAVDRAPAAEEIVQIARAIDEHYEQRLAAVPPERRAEARAVGAQAARKFAEDFMETIGRAERFVAESDDADRAARVARVLSDMERDAPRLVALLSPDATAGAIEDAGRAALDRYQELRALLGLGN